MCRMWHIGGIMQKDTITRTYQLRVCHNSEIYDKLDQTYKLYNRGADFFMTFWKLAMGSLNIADLRPVEWKKTLKEWIEEKQTGRKDTKVVPSALLAFSFWFTLEVRQNQKNIVADKHLEKTFLRYWLSAGGNPEDMLPQELKCLIETLNEGKRKDAVWVDQRKIKGYFPGLDTSFIWADGGDSNKFCRDCLSFWW